MRGAGDVGAGMEEPVSSGPSLGEEGRSLLNTGCVDFVGVQRLADSTAARILRHRVTYG